MGKLNQKKLDELKKWVSSSEFGLYKIHLKDLRYIKAINDNKEWKKENKIGLRISRTDYTSVFEMLIYERGKPIKNCEPRGELK